MPTAITYWFNLARALDDLGGSYAAASGSSTGVVTGGLIDATTGASTHVYDQQWLFNQTTGQSRRVRNGGHTPSTGTFLITATWTAPQANDQIYMSKLFPFVEDGPPSVGYRSLTNYALNKLEIPDTIAVAITPSSYTHSLSTYATWLNRQDRLLRVYEPGPISGQFIPADWRRPRLELDAGAPVLRVDAPFAPGTSGLIVLDVVRPASTLISGSESTTGLLTSSETALPEVQDVLDVALAEAFRVARTRGASAPVGTTWPALLERQDQVAEATIARLAGRARGQPETPAAPAAVGRVA